jgi:ComF family protein
MDTTSNAHPGPSGSYRYRVMRPGRPGRVRVTRKILAMAAGLLSDLFLPALCVHCRKDRWAGTPLCLDCMRKAGPIRFPVCGFCGVPGCALEHPAAGTAEAEIPSRFLFLMGPQLSTLIHGFKYRHLKRHIRFLCAYLRYRPDLAEWCGTFDALAPVPIHSARKRERGYNQAEEIAKEASLHLRLPVIANALSRTRATVSQTKLNREQRARNLENAFRCAEPASIRGKRILLVDDVYTTGATVARCAELLLAAGALSVGVLALAKVDTVQEMDDFAMEMEAVAGYAG